MSHDSVGVTSLLVNLGALETAEVPGSREAGRQGGVCRGELWGSWLPWEEPWWETQGSTFVKTWGKD